MFVVSLPVIFVNAPTSPDKPHSDEFTVLDIVGTVTFVVGFVLEVIADVQRFLFRDNPSNENKWCMSGTLHVVSYDYYDVFAQCMQTYHRRWNLFCLKTSEEDLEVNGYALFFC